MPAGLELTTSLSPGVSSTAVLQLLPSEAVEISDKKCNTSLIFIDSALASKHLSPSNCAKASLKSNPMATISGMPHYTHRGELDSAPNVGVEVDVEGVAARASEKSPDLPVGRDLRASIPFDIMIRVIELKISF